MTDPLRVPWTQDQFFAWAETQDVRHEFDGVQPVAMTGGSAGHAAIGINLQTALRIRLRGTGCRPLGPDAGVQTIGATVRYPGALVTCSGFDLAARVIPDVVVVFEIVSPSSSRTDRIIKLREYAAVRSVLRYVIVESATVGLTVMERSACSDPWRVTTLTNDETLCMPELGINLPVADLYEDVSFPDEQETSI